MVLPAHSVFSTNGMNHSCLCLPSWSWSTHLPSLEGWKAELPLSLFMMPQPQVAFLWVNIVIVLRLRWFECFNVSFRLMSSCLCCVAALLGTKSWFRGSRLSYPQAMYVIMCCHQSSVSHCLLLTTFYGIRDFGLDFVRSICVV